MDSEEKQYIMTIIHDHLLKNDEVYKSWEFGPHSGVSYQLNIKIDDRLYIFKGEDMDPHDNRNLPKEDKDIEAIVAENSIKLERMIETDQLIKRANRSIKDDGDTGC